MPVIELTSIDNFSDIVYMGYGEDLNRMHFLFCVKNKKRNFIFQELHALPFKRIVYSPSDYTITFLSSWSSQEKIESIILDANKEEMKVWENLMDRSRPYNSVPNGFGGHSPHWQFVNVQADFSYKQDSKKRKSMAKKFDTFAEIRIEDIYSANFYNWGFEIFSNSINMVALRHKSLFPYVLNKKENGDEEAHVVQMGEHVSYVDENAMKKAVEWTGLSFVIPDTEFNNNANLISYWNRKSDLYDDFDMELIEMLDSKNSSLVPNMGQRKINIDL